MTTIGARPFALRSPFRALARWLRRIFSPGPVRGDAWPPRHPAEMAMWVRDTQPRRRPASKAVATVEPDVLASSKASRRRPISP